MRTATHARPRRARSAHVAALLSFLWPGLGHYYSGRIQAAAMFALPAAIIALIFLFQLVGGVEQIAVLLITPSSSLTIFILVALLGVWRLVAIADSMLGYGIRNPWRNSQTSRTFAVLAVIVIVSHMVVGYFAWAFYDAGSRIFAGDTDPDRTPPPVLGTDGVGTTPGPAGTPLATPATVQSRVNILLMGIDSAEERTHSLTDTLLVVSIDPVTHDLAMISFPRDIANFPLWDGRTYKGKINGLMQTARSNPEDFPDGPLPTVIKELGFLLGSPIHYYAAVDLDGFRRMIDLVGGVTVDNPKTIDDPRYDWLDSKKLGFYLPAGVHTLDGVTALAYVRSRQGLGDNDFNRARRQQQVLLALRDKLTSPEVLPQLPGILDAAADTISTTFPSERIGEMIEVAKQIDRERIRQVVLGPPYAVNPPDPGDGIYRLELDMERLARLSVEIFGTESAYSGR